MNIPPLTPMSLPTFSSIQELFAHRRSIRYFTEEVIEKQTIDALLEIAEQSPSVENTKPWHFYVVQDQKQKAEIMQHSCYGNFIEGASAIILVTCDKTAQKQASEPMWNVKEMEYSCAIAMEHIMLAASTMDIGSCFISLHHGPVHTWLGLKDSTTVVGGIMLGYIRPSERASNEKHNMRSLEEIATYL